MLPESLNVTRRPKVTSHNASSNSPTKVKEETGVEVPWVSAALRLSNRQPRPATASSTPSASAHSPTVREVGDDEEMEAEKHEPGVPGVREAIDPPEHCRGLPIRAEQAEDADKPTDGDHEDSRVRDPKPGGELRGCFTHWCEHAVEAPRDDNIQSGHEEQAHDAESEQFLVRSDLLRRVHRVPSMVSPLTATK